MCAHSPRQASAACVYSGWCSSRASVSSRACDACASATRPSSTRSKIRQCRASAVSSSAPSRSVIATASSITVSRSSTCSMPSNAAWRPISAAASAPSSAPRRAIVTASAPSVAGRSPASASARCSARRASSRARRASSASPSAVERLLEPRDVGRVGGGRHVEAAAGAERGAGEDVGRALAAGERGGLVERVAGAGLAGLPADVAESDQEVGPALDGERLLEVPCRLLIGVRGDRMPRRRGAVLDRGVGAADLARLEEVVGELAGRRAGGLERVSGAQVQPRAAGVGRRVVERLPHERMREGEAIDVLGVLADDARAQRLLERAEQLLPRPRHHRLERGEREVAAEHGGGGQRLDGVGLQPREPPRDEVLDALGHARRLVGRLLEAAQHLLDEERVAGGAAVQPAWRARGRRPAPPSPPPAGPRARSARRRARG